MNGWTVLTYFYYIGLVFIALWILGTNVKEGLWGNALLAFNWLVAAFGTLAIWQPGLKVALSALKPAPDGQLLILAVAMGLYLVLFLVFFLGMRTATDGLSKVKVAFHPVADTIGSVVFCGLLFLGIAAASLPVIVVLQMGKPA
ncbi:MAG TPA: hypothetical protein VMV10_18260 [Pirellulales bacterium]|nr:hypothetical protein [Pirellulales bacterium]